MRVLKADFDRDNGPESRVTLVVWRGSQIFLRRTRSPLLAPVRVIVKILVVLWIRLAMRAELPSAVWAGPGLKLGHGARGVILHPRVVIGDGVTIFHDVTMGVTRTADEVPVVGNDVLVAVGARILGGVRVADGATVAANSVLLSDAQSDGVYLGVPARLVAQRTERGIPPQ